MAKTPISSLTQFALGSDLTNYRDWRHIADLIRDDDTRQDTLLNTQLHVLVALALRTASGQIESAIYRGGRYDMTDINAIINPAGGAPNNSVARDWLIKLTCDLAFWILITRRKPDADPNLVSGVSDALRWVQALELGEAILPFQEVVDASVDDFIPFDPNRAKSAVNKTPLSTLADRMFGARTRTL